MTWSKGRGPTIPNRKINAGLRGNLNTTGTTEGPNLRSGTNSMGIEGLRYEDIPPQNSHPNQASQNWTVERMGSYLGIALVVITVITFFYRMDSNVEIVKADVKDGKDKIERLDEKVNKQTSSIENVTNSVQRLEGEIRRTQDYVHDGKK